MAQETDKKIINASPTKDFFISMIVRDIELVDAVADLVDNCVDGARRLRPNGSYKKLYAALEVSNLEFRIEDNCGGITADVARNYAFRFGRPKDFPTLEHSIGQFGIGMKRAFFKIGLQFTVESTSPISHFTMTVNVSDWRREPEWEFKFDELIEGEEFLKRSKEFAHPETLVSITDLYPGVAAEFSLENFITRLKEKLAVKHQDSLNKGLQITVNRDPLKSAPATLLRSKLLKPIVENFKLPGKINVRLYAGLSESDPNKAGWYVFCNGRLILEADQTERTGWGETKVTGETSNQRKKTRIPYYHNQFARFRGYVFFDANNAAVLPWTTTKTDVDLNSPAFQATRQRMVLAMRPIIDFLNDLDGERSSEKRSKPLTKAVTSSREGQLATLKISKVFVAPKASPLTISGPTLQRISYQRPTAEISLVRKTLKVRKLQEVGERTFEYYLRAECTK